MLKVKIQQILILLLSSVFALVSFEFFLNFSPFVYNTSPVIYDEKIGMWHKKNYESYIQDDCYKTKYIFDHQGLQKNIYNYDKTKKDVILLGASMVEALMVQNENVIHNSLAKEFKQKYNFMNYALAGSGPTQQYVILKDKVNLENVKYVIHFIEIEGDLLDVMSTNLSPLARPKVFVEFNSLNDYQIVPPRDKSIIDTIGDFLGNYQLYSYLKRVIYHIKDSRSIQNNKPIKKTNSNNYTKDFSTNWLFIKGAIHQINNLLKSAEENIEYKIIFTSNNDQNVKTMEAFLKNKNIKYMHLNKIFKSNGMNLKGFKCDGHWNDETHKNIAKLINISSFIN
jgi:hypothetical protein